MGKAFGREWEFEVSSPNEALRMVDANKPGLFRWIKSNLKKYESYRVIVKYKSGVEEELEKDGYGLVREMESIRFVPLVEGAGDTGKVILGVILIVVGIIYDWSGTTSQFGMAMVMAGAGMLVGGVAGMLSPQPKRPGSPGENEAQQKDDRASYYFDGPTNTTSQGAPVQLIYGRVLVGSHTISAAATVDQLM